jgi:hypothetical protein
MQAHEVWLPAEVKATGGLEFPHSVARIMLRGKPELLGSPIFMRR